VRINISLAKSLLREMDAAADLQGMTRSGFIAEATQEYIDRIRMSRMPMRETDQGNGASSLLT
jgi:metal-responsive CopG/Arc/MetJ family transcriptional regulator